MTIVQAFSKTVYHILVVDMLPDFGTNQKLLIHSKSLFERTFAAETAPIRMIKFQYSIKLLEYYSISFNFSCHLLICIKMPQILLYFILFNF